MDSARGDLWSDTEAWTGWHFHMIAASLALTLGTVILWIGVTLNGSGWFLFLLPMLAALPAVILHTLA